jgi:cell division transport system permease protein
MWLQFKRTFLSGISNAMHNFWLALSVISVIAVALFIINIQIANIVANDLLLKDLQDRVNISIYLKEDVKAEDIRKIKEEIEKFPEVERVVYIPKEQTLERFNRDSEENQTMKEVLGILEENPFEDILNVKAHNPDDYAQISQKLQGEEFKSQIDSVNYEEHKDVINGLNNEIKSSQKMAIILGVILSAIAILVTFNTITITIYTHRKEIEIMKLVGASNTYVTMPFVWEGFLYGVVGAIIAIVVSYLYLHSISGGDNGDTLLFLSNTKFIKQFLGDYFVKNILIAVGLQFVLGILLGVVSSFIAIRRYLKV